MKSRSELENDVKVYQKALEKAKESLADFNLCRSGTYRLFRVDGWSRPIRVVCIRERIYYLEDSPNNAEYYSLPLAPNASYTVLGKFGEDLLWVLPEGVDLSGFRVFADMDKGYPFEAARDQAQKDRITLNCGGWTFPIVQTKEIGLKLLRLCRSIEGGK